MTKLRPACSFEDALGRIGTGIRFEVAGRIVGRSASTLRTWTDPDVEPQAGDMITLNMAKNLDAAYRSAGGQGSPLLDCFATLVDLEFLAACPDAVAIATSTSTAVKESGEALSAAVAASLPGASDAALALAERELQQSIDAHRHTLAQVQARRKARGEVQSPGGENQGHA